MPIELYEHITHSLSYPEGENPYYLLNPRTFKDKKGNNIGYFEINHSNCRTKTEIKANYHIGVDWLISDSENKEYIYIAPKINTTVTTLFNSETEIIKKAIPDIDILSFDKKKDFKELNYLKMYLDAVTNPEVLRYTKNLLFVDWNAPEISIKQKEDLLTPFLVVQFLNLLKQIVRKGLKKSYYKVQSNLQGRIKGKILITQNIKTNVFKNRLSNTVCEYQEFGVDSKENRFLKKVLLFVSNYIANNQIVFKGNELALIQIIAYCKPAFENVSSENIDFDLKHLKINVLFKEYKETIKIGHYILKRLAYNISSTALEKVTTPPFWIDMSRLFELYTYHQLLKVFAPEDIKYHFSTYGNELDFLLTKEGSKMVIDAKYKLHYDKGHIHEDIRQISGYARLNRVYQELNIIDDKLIPCLIIYPDLNAAGELPKSDSLLNDTNEIGAYKKVHKIGISLPLI